MNVTIEVKFADQGEIFSSRVTIPELPVVAGKPVLDVSQLYVRFLDATCWHEGHCIESAEDVYRKIMKALEVAQG